MFKNSSKPNLGPLHRHTRHVSHRVSLRKPVYSHRGVHQNASTVLFSKKDVPWAVPPARPNPLSSLRHPRLKPVLSERRVSGIEIASHSWQEAVTYSLMLGCTYPVLSHFLRRSWTTSSQREWLFTSAEGCPQPSPWPPQVQLPVTLITATSASS